MSRSEETVITSGDGTALDATHCFPEGQTEGVVLLVHGITAEKDEGGMYARLAEALADRGYESIRFSFRGHGCSDGSGLDVTIAGEMTDVVAAVGRCLQSASELSVVATSFGAVVSIALFESSDLPIAKLVLWNPVLSLRATFLEPTSEWGLANFGWARIHAARRAGHLTVDGAFTLSPALFDEMSLHDIEGAFSRLTMPSLVVQATDDAYVSFDIAKRSAMANVHSAFFELPGADHGFGKAADETLAIAETVQFICGTPTWSAGPSGAR
jgi:pimeloyl-ACP methyl ester carboxylesterase